MKNRKDVNWFRKFIVPNIQHFDLNWAFFENGDFGDLDRVDYDSDKIGFEVDFWSSGWIGFFVYDVENDRILLNSLLEPTQESEIEEAFEKLLRFLG